MAKQTGSIDLKAMKSVNDDARKVADNYLATDSSGIMIYDGTNGTGQTPSNPDADTNNVFIDDDSLDIRRGTDVLATFGADVTRIGKEYVAGATDNESHLELDYHSLLLVDNESNPYFYVSDLRNKEDIYLATDGYYADGTTYRFQLALKAERLRRVNVQGTFYTIGTDVVLESDGVTVNFYRIPPAGEFIFIESETVSPEAKALTFGWRTQGNIGGMSVVEGSSRAQGSYSHAEGFWTKADGNYSHSEGYYAKASGTHSHAEGSNTTASGGNSHAEGYDTTAKGNYSHAQNYHTSANWDSQTTIGKYNDNKVNTAFEIGNGTSDTARSNALTVDWSGNVDIAAGAKYKINGTALSASDVGAISDVQLNGSSIKSGTTANLLTGSLINMFYPVGSYYETSDTTFDPNTDWGGTWQLETEGQVHISAGTNYTVSGALTDTTDGGSEFIQEHAHVFTNPTYTTAGAGSHSHAPGIANRVFVTSTSGVEFTRHSRKQGTGTEVTYLVKSTQALGYASTTDAEANHSHTVNLNSNGVVGVVSGETTGNAGNMQPYIVVNRWHRTA